ncbi:MAG: hypothetical protein ABIL16_03525 [candidate division WOR-3 bacterium]
MRYAFKVFALLSLLVLGLKAQTWAGLSTYGGTNYDQMWAIDFMGGTTPVLGMFTISYSISGSDEDYVLITPSWQKVIGNTGGRDDWMYKTQWLNSGNIVVGGAWCNDGGAGPGSCYAPLYGFVVGLNSSGNFLWGRHLDFSNLWGCSGNTNRQTRVMHVSPTSDGGFLAAGFLTYNIDDGWGSCITNDADGFIAKFNSTANLQWIRIVDWAADWNIATTAFETTDGNYVLLAPSWYEVGVLKFDPSGSLIWQRRYPRSIATSTITFSWGKLTSDGGFILATHIAGSGDDALFMKFNSSGNFVCAAVISTSGNDYGIDVVEGPNWYWMTGSLGVSGNDLFIAKIRKTDCNVIEVRRLLSGADEQGRSMDIRPVTGIPYVAGYTNNTAWSVGNYDGLVAADSGGLDTCYWRNYSPTITYPTFSASGSFTVYYPSMSTSGYTVSVQNISVARRINCGLDPLGEGDEELGMDERFVSCEINYTVIGNNLRLRVKSERGVDVKIYTPNGVKVFDEGFVKSGVYNIPLRRGVYFLKAGGKTEKIVIL